MKPSSKQLDSDLAQAPVAARRVTQSTVDSRRVHSASLMGTARELLIEHAGCTYRLRVTQANKLILTK